MDIISPDLLVLRRLYHWEKTIPQSISLTQPMEDRKIRDHSRDEVADPVRRMAAHRHAALVCKVARHLYRGPAARPAYHLFLGSTGCGSSSSRAYTTRCRRPGSSCCCRFR
ncbi:hypothetical protein IWX87_002085 [Polaromonas sp. CG_9.7]|nr:hypothetical protein [Polaromonas sp. CG_9.7]MBG6114245.1 hypothetical protein [Polaromonas sp. CG_9.2]MDH6182797.1 hypothetical protein [Polaromonas sp. CG_23.6]